MCLYSVEVSHPIDIHALIHESEFRRIQSALGGIFRPEIDRISVVFLLLDSLGKICFHSSLDSALLHVHYIIGVLFH